MRAAREFESQREPQCSKVKCTVCRGKGHSDRECTVKETAPVAAVDDDVESSESSEEPEPFSGVARSSAASSRKASKSKEGQYALDE